LLPSGAKKLQKKFGKKPLKPQAKKIEMSSNVISVNESYNGRGSAINRSLDGSTYPG
jgi:hypothetical protein